jgi:hypothetical protein
MNAGQALGLLAGMGALSALGRGTDLQGNRFTGLLDMIDGGGGGKSGDRFEGGGLLSILGNLFAKPYEAQQRVEDIATRASTRDRSSSPVPQLRPNMTTGTPITEYSDSLLAPIVNEDVYGIGNAGEYGGVPSVTPDVYNIGSAGEYGGLMAPANMPRPVATTAALSPAGDTASGVAPVAPMSEQLGLIAPATPTTAYPSGMSPEAPYIPQEIMSFREFVDAERAAMSGADRYLDPANYRRGYAQYLRSMGIDPVLMGM